MSGKFIDTEQWPRRAQYNFYREYDAPFFSLTTDVCVTELRRASRKPGGPSFFLATLHAALQAANQQQAFRLRLRPEGVWRHDVVHGGSTVLRDDETFGFGYFDYVPEYSTFELAAKMRINSVKLNSSFEPRDDRDDLIHFSVLPWIRFTSFTHAQRLGSGDSVPKIVFGKYEDRSGDIRMPVSVAVHHALVDGIHVGHFLSAFEQALREPVHDVPLM